MPFWDRKKEPELASKPPAWVKEAIAQPIPARPAYTPPPSPAAPVAPKTEGLTFHPDGNITVSLGSVAEAKLAIKQARLKKKEIGLEKKTVAARMTEMRAERRLEVANQGSKMRGGGGFGKTVRAVQSASRDADRASHARALAPYEAEKARLEGIQHALDNIIIQLEQYVLQQSASE